MIDPKDFLLINAFSSILKVKIKKLHPDAVIPTRGTSGSAGMDIVTIRGDYSNENYIEYKTGLSFEIPPGYVGLLFPRSSICKTDLSLCNAVGILDSDFRGEVTFRFKCVKNYGKLSPVDTYSYGDKIGQIVILPYPDFEFVESEELSDTKRGSGGYGSTGR